MEKTKETAEKLPVMPKEAKYDVFISYSRRDCLDENKKLWENSPVWRLWKYLDAHGVECWIDIEGIYSGSQFAGLIADAINESKMMVFVSSERSNSSIWTVGEVITALNEGKTIIPFRIDRTPYSKKFSVPLNAFDYIDWTPDSDASFGSLLRSVETVKKLYDEKLAEQKKVIERNEQEVKNTEIREHIIQTVRDYSTQAARLRNLFDDIAKSHLALGEKEKICPVCGKTVSVGSRFCKHCGWIFVPPFAISGGTDQLPSGDPELIGLMQSIWQKNQSVEATEKSLRKRINELEENLKSVNNPSTDTSFTHKVHEYVDLGLPHRLLWATCNVGAKDNKPEEYGDYFAWGETEPKSSYEWSNLKYCNDDAGSSFSKYNKDQKGTKDRKMQLELSDDAAHVKWGGSWRMPAKEDWEELYANCSRKWTKESGVKGWRFTSRNNGNSIFLPAAGYCGGDNLYHAGEHGFYWSSSLNAVDTYGAHCCYFNSSDVGPSDWNSRYDGFSVRPVASPSLQ